MERSSSERMDTQETPHRPDRPDQAVTNDVTSGTGTRDIGIDVSKARRDGAVRPRGTAWQSSNDETGIAALVPRLQVLAPPLIVLAATSLAAWNGG